MQLLIVPSEGVVSQRLKPSPWTSCEGVDWSAIRADAGAYELIVVSSPPQGGSPVARMAPAEGDGLIVSEPVPLRALAELTQGDLDSMGIGYDEPVVTGGW